MIPWKDKPPEDKWLRCIPGAREITTMSDNARSRSKSADKWPFQILDEAKNVFGSKAEARQWMNSPQRGLEFQKPIEMVDTGVGAGCVPEY